MAHRSSVASSEDVSRLERVADVQFVAPCRAALTVGGVGVFTTATVPAGTTLLAERPFALTASWERRKHVCDWCMAEDEVSPYPLCCKSCGSVAYCSDACARSATRHSALECEAFAAFAADDDDEGVAPCCGRFGEGVLLLGGHRCDLCGTLLDENGRCAQPAVLSFAAAAPYS